MDNELENVDTTEVSPGPSRRQVVRIGANLAWAVPAVAVVTSAPALAASGKAKLVAPGFTAAATTTKITLKMGAVKNSGPGDAGVPTASFSFAFTAASKPTIKSVKGTAGWTQSGGAKGLKFTSKGGKLLAGKSTSALTLTVAITAKKKNKKAVKPAGTAKVVVVASNASPTSVSKSDKL